MSSLGRSFKEGPLWCRSGAGLESGELQRQYDNKKFAFFDTILAVIAGCFPRNYVAASPKNDEIASHWTRLAVLSKMRAADKAAPPHAAAALGRSTFGQIDNGEILPSLGVRAYARRTFSATAGPDTSDSRGPARAAGFRNRFLDGQADDQQQYGDRETVPRANESSSPQSLPGGRLAPLGIRAIGHNTVWQYEADLSVLAIETMRNGAGLTRMFPYIRNTCECRGYSYLPVLNDAALEAAQRGRIRELAVRVATPVNLETVTADQRQMKQGLIELMGPQLSTQIEIRYKAGARDPDIQPNRFVQAVTWFRREKRADRGTISKLEAKIMEEDGHYNTLDLLDAHLGERRDLDLPNDDPDRSAAIRFANMAQIFNANRAILQKQFGR